MTNSNNTTSSLPKFTIKQMLEAGVHFGHKTMRRNPKMAKYVFCNRNDLSIIDLEQTALHLHNSLKAVREIAKNNGRILFVSTKKQAFDIVEDSAKRCGQYYVNNRWLGGMLTNWKTISKSIKTLKKIEDQLNDDKIGLNKKERLVLDRQRIKLNNALGGIRNMGGYPDLVFVIDIRRESIAIAEAKKLGVPIMAILDTNCNPDGITFPIPGNDDSVKAIKLYCHLISDAILMGIKENMALAGIDVNKNDNNSSSSKNSKVDNYKKNDKSKEKSSTIQNKKEEARVQHKTQPEVTVKIDNKKLTKPKSSKPVVEKNTTKPKTSKKSPIKNPPSTTKL